ncbi:MAG: hypothetical protein IJI13_06510 [Oscillospiraceae bacterium]|nr:hypothetical protein [Oscillospiraceae bacterium]
MTLYKSGEDYLKAILVLTNRNGAVRSLDVANYLNVTKPSVCRARYLPEFSLQLEPNLF